MISLLIKNAQVPFFMTPWILESLEKISGYPGIPWRFDRYGPQINLEQNFTLMNNSKALYGTHATSTFQIRFYKAMCGKYNNITYNISKSAIFYEI